MRIFSSAEYCFRVARRMSRTSFSGVPAVESDYASTTQEAHKKEYRIIG
jgi:hypothetical protein